MSDSDDKKTERDKLFAEQRAIKDTVRGPSNLQVRSLRQGFFVGSALSSSSSSSSKCPWSYCCSCFAWRHSLASNRLSAWDCADSCSLMRQHSILHKHRGWAYLVGGRGLFQASDFPCITRF
jgi:hypothetical protein